MIKRNLHICVVILICLLSSALRAQNYTVLNDAIIAQGCNCYQLTPDQMSQAGGVYHNSSISLSNSFDYTFSVYLGCNNGLGADGMVFILTDNITGIGTLGSGMGYGGLGGNSVGIEFDTYQNGWDPVYHHIAIETDGQVEHPTGTIAGPVPATPTSAYIDDCSYHLVRIIWDVPSLTYSVYFDGNLRTSYTGDMVANFFGGNPIVNWGWSGGTGALMNQQIVCVKNSSTWVAGNSYTSCSPGIAFTDSTTSNVSNVVSWSWNFGDTASGAADSSSLQSPSHHYTAPGAYTVVVIATDDSQCPDTVTHTVFVDSISAVPSVTGVLCHGTSTGAISLSVSGIQLPDTVLWSIADTGTSIAGLSAGTYTYHISDSIGCRYTDSVAVSQPAAIVPSITRVDSTCFGLCTGSILASASGGISPYMYSMDDVTFSPSDTLAGLCANSYTVYIKDNNGCIDSISQRIVELPQPTLSVLPHDTLLSYGDTVQLVPQFGPASLGSPSQYTWASYPTQTLSCLTCAVPTSASTDSLNVYSLNLTYHNGICMASFTDTIRVSQQDTFAIPTAFTPNNDGMNDTYYIMANNVRSFHLDIFNRWGENIFTTNDINTKWDGTYKGKLQPVGEYTLFLSMQYGKDKSLQKTSTVTLLQ